MHAPQSASRPTLYFNRKYLAVADSQVIDFSIGALCGARPIVKVALMPGDQFLSNKLFSQFSAIEAKKILFLISGSSIYSASEPSHAISALILQWLLRARDLITQCCFASESTAISLPAVASAARRLGQPIPLPPMARRLVRA